MPSPLLELLSETSRRRCGLALLLIHGVTSNALEGIVAIQQVHPSTVGHLEAPLGRLEHGPGRGTDAGEAHDGRLPGALDGEADVDAAVHLVHLAGYPGDLVLEVDLVAEKLARLLVRAQRVHGRGHDRARHLLVVENGDAR